MDQLGSSPFPNIVKEALNEYFRNSSNDSFTVLYVCADDAPLLRTRVYAFQNSGNSPLVVGVSGEPTSLTLTYQNSKPLEPVSDQLTQTDQIEVSDKARALRQIIQWGLSSASIEHFDLIITYRAISILSSFQSSRDIEEDTCKSILREFSKALVLGGFLVLGEVYSPSWLVGFGSDSLNDDSLTQRVGQSQGIKPDKLIELATYKLSDPKAGYDYLRVPLFNVRIREPLPKNRTVTSSWIAREEYFADGTREFALALERSKKSFDDSRIIETAKHENEKILVSLEQHIKKGREDSTPTEYRRHLKALLSLGDQPNNSLYARLARCLYLQVLLEGINGGIDLLAARMIFWMAYESSAADSEVMAATEADPQYPLFGYSFGPPHKDQPSRQSLSRYWLNIILNNEGHSSDLDGCPPLHPPSVHDWFVRHSPKVLLSRVPFEEQPLETLTLYLGSPENRTLALIEGHNSSRRHHRIELAPFRFSNEGEDWGFQLAEELARIATSLPMSPYEDIPWPYEESDRANDLIPSEITVSAFKEESRRIMLRLDRHEPLNASRGWLRASLYSVFLTMCLGKVKDRCREHPSWLTFFKTVLSTLGYSSLVKRIDQASADSISFLDLAKHQNLTSFTWVAPPVLLSLIEAKARPLGSILIISSQLLPVTAFRQLKNQLLSTFVALREGEELIESEHRARQTSLLEGHARSVEGFSHEISKFADAISHQYLLPLDRVFQIEGESEKDKSQSWLVPAGSIVTKESLRSTIKNWRVCPTPSLIDGISDVLYMWSSSPWWWESQRLNRKQTIKDALIVIREVGIRVGVAMRVGMSSDLPNSVELATAIEDEVNTFQEKFEAIFPKIKYSGPELHWHGVDETRFAESAYARMLVVSISNAVNSLDLKAPRCEMSVEARDSEIGFTLTNSREVKPSELTRLPYFGSTRSALENCVRILNNGAAPEAFLTFHSDPQDGTTWITRTRASLVVRNREGKEVEWLSKFS